MRKVRGAVNRAMQWACGRLARIHDCCHPGAPDFSAGIRRHWYCLHIEDCLRPLSRLVWRLTYPTCDEHGCSESGYHCELPDGTAFAYCYAHMRANGFCRGCGLFWAGVESFDFSGHGYCDNCASQYVDDCFDEYEPDWDAWEAEIRP